MKPTEIQELKDQQLAKTIRQRIQWDKRISPMDIRVQVRNEVAVLIGEVDSPFRKQAAIDLIESTHGVLGIKDHIEVINHFMRPDRELKGIIQKQLMAIERMTGEYINVDVADGCVKLEGIVFRARLKGFAAGVVWELSGVNDCLNMIEVKDPPMVQINRILEKRKLAHSTAI